MSKAKSRKKVIALSAVAVSSVAIASYTVSSMAENRETKDPTALNLNIDKIDKDTVKISVDNITEAIKSLQLSLEIPSGAKFASEDAIKWLVKDSESIQKNIRISNQGKYLDILIVSDEELDRDGSKLDICEIDVAKLDSIVGAKSSGYKIVPRENDNNTSYTYVVTNTNKSKSGNNIVNSSDDMLKINTLPTISLKEGTINEAIISGNKIEVKEGYDFNANFKSFVEVSDEDGTLDDSNISLDGNVNTSVAGSYNVKIVVTDADQDKGEVSIVVNVTPEKVTESPTITGVKDKHTIYAGQVFDPMEGVTAKDAKNNELEVVMSGDFNIEEAGEYTLTYTAKDKWGNVAKETSVITVIKDEAPVITGVSDKTIEKYDDFDPLDGVEVTDDNDKDIKSKLKVTGEVNNKVVGEYKLSYSVTDSANNTTKAQRIITVEAKVTSGSVINKAPVITGVKDQTIKVGQEFDPKLGVKANDAEEGDLTSSIKIDGNVDINNPGEYKLTYTVQDSKGAKSTVSCIITVEKEESPETPETPENPSTPEEPETPVVPSNPVIPPSISDKLDSNVVEIVTGNGEKDTPLELEIKEVDVKDLNNFLNSLKDLNPVVESISKDDKYTVYKIKLENNPSSLLAKLFKSSKSNDNIYLDIKVKNTYTELVSTLNEFAKETNQSIVIPEDKPTQTPEVDDDNISEETDKDNNLDNSDTTGSNSNGNSENSNTNESEETTDDSNTIENPKSGDSTILGYIGLGAIASGALFVNIRKKKK